MSKVVYYRAEGETEKQLVVLLRDRKPRLQALVDFYRKHGGHDSNIAYNDTGFGFQSYMCPAEGAVPDPKLWKMRNKANRQAWVPKENTKTGKAIAAEIAELEKGFPSRRKCTAVIKLDPFDGLKMVGAGFHLIEEPLLVLVEVYNEKYSPPEGVSLVRISDLEYESLTKAKSE